MGSKLTTSQDVLILEEKIDKPVSDFDHVFSFRANSANSFPDHYMTQAEADVIYEETYEAMCDYLRKYTLKSVFVYRGIDLLWCFKKALFEYAYLGRVRYELFKSVRAKHPSSQFHLCNGSAETRGPRLSEILEASPLREISDIHRLEESLPAAPDKKSQNRNGRRIAFPSFLTLGNLGKCKTAVFYDLKKSQNILKQLKPHGCVLFSNSEPRRTLLRTLVQSLPLCQLTYHSRQAARYHEAADSFHAKLSRYKLFDDFILDDLAWEKLLGERLKQLFEFELAKLLFEIDQTHRFFKKAHALKTVLLDEDISSSKIAFCQIARQYQVSTFVECHGLIGGKHGFVPLNADKIFVWGRAQKSKLTKWGCPEGKIIVSGHSRYGQYQQMDGKALRQKVSKKFGLNPNQKIALFAFPPITHSWFLIFEHKMKQIILETLETATQLLQEHTDLQIVLKIHPADQEKAFYRGWVKKNNTSNRFVAIENYDPLILAKAVDFLVVYGSTYAVDGFAMGKPVIVLHDDSWFFEEFREFSVFTYANSANEFKNAVLQLIKSPEMRSTRWDEARRECLNEGDRDPEELIASYLTQGIALEQATR